MSKRALVVDYGIGNVFSVCNALRAVGIEADLTGDLAAIRSADRLILPGVGAFGRAMDALQAGGIADALRDFVATERPFLGICIGMQVLMERSNEFGDRAGLCLVPGEVRRVDEETGERRVPHIGWATLRSDDGIAHWEGTPLTALHSDSDALYFVHSYHCKPRDRADRIAYADYDGLEITAAIRRDNIVGVQFHPERSGLVGQRILSAFKDL